jgi:hypothetical protein
MDLLHTLDLDGLHLLAILFVLVPIWLLSFVAETPFGDDNDWLLFARTFLLVLIQVT